MEPDERGGDVWPERAVALYCAMLVVVLLVVGLMITEGPKSSVNAAQTPPSIVEPTVSPTRTEEPTATAKPTSTLPMTPTPPSPSLPTTTPVVPPTSALTPTPIPLP